VNNHFHILPFDAMRQNVFETLGIQYIIRSLLDGSFMPLLKERELRRSPYFRNIRVRSTGPSYD